ncbi:hypothetical protein H8356DRAFT_1706789 [Neocallimastix lanati (nom. inval.)]|nr:hypothetical protein H8356DRAFT_1706789 [Neocallimastix sp. JGI-2020a]
MKFFNFFRIGSMYLHIEELSSIINTMSELISLLSISLSLQTVMFLYGPVGHSISKVDILVLISSVVVDVVSSVVIEVKVVSSVVVEVVSSAEVIEVKVVSSVVVEVVSSAEVIEVKVVSSVVVEVVSSAEVIEVLSSAITKIIVLELPSLHSNSLVFSKFSSPYSL